MEYHKLLSEDFYNGHEWILNAKGVHKNIPYLIMSNNFPTCHVGIHKSSKAYDIIGLRDMGEIYFSDVECTEMMKGKGKYKPDEFLWLGWDYAHAGDYTNFPEAISYGRDDDHKYTMQELMKDIRSCIYDVKNKFRYAMVNGKMRYMPLNPTRGARMLPEDCVVQPVKPKFEYGNFDVDLIKGFKLSDG